MDESTQTYLGDGVYARFDGWHVWLTTERGFGDEHQIALDPDTYRALVAFVDRITASQ